MIWVRSDVFSDKGGSQVLFDRIRQLLCGVDVLSVCAQEQFKGDVGDGLSSLLMFRCVSLS